jgi:hypothetical protein
MELLADAACCDDSHGTPQPGHVGAHCSSMQWQGTLVQLIELCFDICTTICFVSTVCATYAVAANCRAQGVVCMMHQQSCACVVYRFYMLPCNS